MEPKLKYEPVSAWEKYQDQLSQLTMTDVANYYVNFLSECKTERETVEWALKELEEDGFSSKGDKIVRPFRNKALFAACTGKQGPAGGFNLIACHGDSPRLDFKQHPFIEQAGIAQAKTHYYGGIRKYQWLARPLALHGAVILQNGEKVKVSVGEDPREPVFCIADLLPHLAKKQEDQKLLDVFEAEKLNIVLAHEPALGEKKEGEDKDPVKRKLLETLHKLYGIVEEDMITAEFEAVPAGRARYVGFDQRLIGGYGQDDRICVFCGLMAFLDISRRLPTRPLAFMLWDKEEIGSEGATGASSRFLQFCIEELAGDGNAAQIFMNTRAISADVTAALDPDYQDVHEKHNAALLGYGPAFSKFTGSGGKYGASEADAEYFAMLRNLFNKEGIPWQAAELGKVDNGGGGTVALFLAAYGMNVIDLGPALLSMHSPFELSSVADLYATFEAYRAFYRSE